MACGARHSARQSSVASIWCARQERSGMGTLPQLLLTDQWARDSYSMHCLRASTQYFADSVQRISLQAPARGQMSWCWPWTQLVSLTMPWRVQLMCTCWFTASTAKTRDPQNTHFVETTPCKLLGYRCRCRVCNLLDHQ
jgi:hypothetical protein